MARPISELINTADPGINLIHEWARDNSEPCEILPPDEGLRSDILLQLQVTTRSILGAVAYETGGILALNKRVRILGSGSDRSLLTANGTIGGHSGLLIVGDDILGGAFALNGGHFGNEAIGQIYYLAADDLVWTSLDVGYTDFIYYFESYVQEPPPFNKALSIIPFLWSKESRNGPVSVAVIDATEAVNVHIDIAGQLTEEAS
ncbi:hypothetical protein J7337_003264 [Fusarium musae]|uniref:Uncharacterized protein n=1 Tax=Fusarium musae TaxID=1042133 RepID=A0A9P8DQF9_9HYPO|nr:hypothetical protein J7337_003264 [Fusarium musae]KAG9506282.1 hypothetical protein J7337_003264 [Fusarium musae]